MATIWSSTKRPLYPHRAEVRSQKRRSCAKAPDENRAAAAVVAMMNVCMMGSLVRPDDSPEAFAKIAEVPATITDEIFKACPPWASMLLQFRVRRLRRPVSG
jgi:hypothetical protein